MSKFRKVAVTLPADTYAALEKQRDRLGKSRSEVVAFAVKEWLRGLDASEARRRYMAGYLRTPEAVDDSVVAVATSDWSTWEPGAPSRAAEPSRRAKR